MKEGDINSRKRHRSEGEIDAEEPGAEEGNTNAAYSEGNGFTSSQNKGSQQQMIKTEPSEDASVTCELQTRRVSHTKEPSNGLGSTGNEPRQRDSESLVCEPMFSSGEVTIREGKELCPVLKYLIVNMKMYLSFEVIVKCNSNI